MKKYSFLLLIVCLSTTTLVYAQGAPTNRLNINIRDYCDPATLSTLRSEMGLVCGTPRLEPSRFPASLLRRQLTSLSGHGALPHYPPGSRPAPA